MRRELSPDRRIEFYAPGELEKIMAGEMGIGDERVLAATNEASRPALIAVTALQTFGGARLEEALRLDWEALHRTPGYVEISGQHAKTRKRRLLEVGPGLAEWLVQFKGWTGRIWSQPVNSFITEWARLREAVGVPSRRNGVRHGFASFSYVLQGEIETAALAGTSPQILHENYRGLARREEAEAWFAIQPPKMADNLVALATVVANP